MDPITCCLLGICCPPEARQQKIAQWIGSIGVDHAASEKVAAALIEKIDGLVNGLFLKQIIAAARQHKG